MNPAPRLASLDALRGFDMLWITGGRTVVAAAAAASGFGPLVWLEAQMHHPAWFGFTLWDLVFPLFLFVSGVTLPFAQDRRREEGVPRHVLARRIVRRALLLVLLGAVYNGLLTFDLEHQRWASVLGRIGLAWAGAATVALFCGWRGRLATALGLLLGYALLLALWPVPAGAGTLLQGLNVVDRFDQLFLPGRLHRGDHDPEGWLATLPAVATALFGVLAGMRLRAAGEPRRRSVVELAAAAAVALLAGWLVGQWQPVCKELWTPAFALVTAGASALLLAVFHGAIEVWGARRLAFPFVVLGSNAIALYLLDRAVDFDGVAALLLRREPVVFDAVVVALVAVGLRWTCLYALWRRRLFLRV